MADVLVEVEGGSIGRKQIPLVPAPRRGTRTCQRERWVGLDLDQLIAVAESPSLRFLDETVPTGVSRPSDAANSCQRVAVIERVDRIPGRDRPRPLELASSRCRIKRACGLPGSLARISVERSRASAAVRTTHSTFMSATFASP